MDWKKEWKKLAVIVAVFLGCFYLPAGWGRFDNAVMESLHLIKWYAQEHVLLCLIPAFFIAGAVSVFVSKASVMKYLGAKANKILAYGVASVSGTILAVCSCTVLPLFFGIYRMGAGLGPAVAFLYSGPAINILAVILTARILGLELGIARAVGAVVFSVVIGLTMHFIYRKEELEKADGQMNMPEPEVSRPLWQNGLFFGVMIGVLVFANWGAPNDFHFKTENGETFRAAVIESPEHSGREDGAYVLKILVGENAGEEAEIKAENIASKEAAAGAWTSIWKHKWVITSVFAVALAVILIFWFSIPAWKIIVGAVPVGILAFALPMEGMMVMIPFSAGVIALSWAASTTEGEAEEWFSSTWSFAKQILPLLFFGVIVAGLLLGRPGNEGLIPSEWVASAVGGNSVSANLFASVAGAFMYFATLTEVPILQGLIGAGMGKGPALALLLAGPALSLPNMLVIRSVMGTKKTLVFIALVIVMATICGIIFGSFF
ncbi:permease [Sedimentisphaera salicampi]|uniref:Putative permease n=1 Tax=Sedimentisphaera salicampi TaxID=1941349 RepID=A0A1W6LMT0_9BACT|nr:permease [Sedimentisphaera salicampi]ARN57085.1 putative permease [Sedimentisphaera salicampi]